MNKPGKSATIALALLTWSAMPSAADVPDALMAESPSAPPGYYIDMPLEDVDIFQGTGGATGVGARDYTDGDGNLPSGPGQSTAAHESAHAVQQGTSSGLQQLSTPSSSPAESLERLAAEQAICRSPCGWAVLGLTVADITSGISSQYGQVPSGRNLAYVGPFSASSQPGLLDSFSSWTVRFQPEPDYSIRVNSGNHWHMLVQDQYVPGLVTTFDPRGLDQLPTAGSQIIGSLFGGATAHDAVLLAVANGQNLALLGQSALNIAGLLPIHVYVQWDAGVRDLDLHATGPLGAGRFHVYFSSPGSLALEPNTLLHVDCVCEGGSEVITLSDINPGGVYRFSVFNFGNQDPTSTELSESALTLTVFAGGTVISQPAFDGSPGSAVSGGTVVLETIAPPAGVPGNTWVAVEVDPNTGSIIGVNRITNSASSAAVQ